MRLKLSLLLVFIITYSWSQSGSTKTFTGNGTFSVPAGVTSLNVQAWGGGGSGGGASGAPLLLGRGAAGGGGGAYASNTLLVTPGATLNVVVASQTSGTNGAGVAGGNSTITGFESSILAAGGSGGDANNAGGSPTGGIGGTIAASAGSIKFAGANGGNGNSWNLLGLLLSSGAGGAGAGSGGAGGTAVSGLILSNAPGNAGSPPGGAGSGAINSALGTSQIGGAGAAGRVVIAYSCSNFSLTSTTATSICASAGITSLVTLTGSVASLPVGSYLVTYNLSNPVATGLGAALTVSTAGTGTFTAAGLVNLGSSTITITNLTSESCSSNITTNNTATITVSPASVGGTVTGGTTINAGSTSGLLTLSGHTGTVVKWQSAVSPFTTWSDIANINTTYTSGPLTETTQFRAVVQSGTCATANSTSTTVTVAPRPTITLATSATSACSSAAAQSTNLSYSATTGSPTTYSIVWNGSPINSFAAVTDAVLPASPISIAIPAGTIDGTYTGTLTVKNANGSVSSPGSTFSVTVNQVPTITALSSSQIYCSGANETPTSLFYSGATGSPVTYSIVWNSFPTNNFTNVTDAILPVSPIGFTIPSGILAGTYTGTLTVKSANGCTSLGSAFTINIKETSKITTTGTINSVCASSNLQNATLAYSGSTGNPTGYSIVWSNEADNAGLLEQFYTPFNFASGGGLIDTIEIPGNVPAGTYSGTLSVKGLFCDSTIPISVVIKPLPTIKRAFVSGGVCSGATDATSISLFYSELSGSPTTYSIVWDASSPSNNLANVIDAALLPDELTIVFPAGTAAGEYNGIVTVKNEDGCVSVGSPFTIEVGETPTIALTQSEFNVCAANFNLRSTINIPYSGTTGSPNTYSIAWDPSPSNNLPEITNEEFSESPISFSIPGLAPGTYTGILTVRNDSCISSDSVITINVAPKPTITTTGTIDTVCSSDATQNATLTYSASTNNPVSYSIDWDDDNFADQGNTSFSFTSGGGIINNIVVPANVSAGNYSGTIYISDGNCENFFPVSITINDSPSVTFKNTTINTCFGYSSFEDVFYFAAVNGSPTTYSIAWNSSPTNNLVSVTDAALAPDGVYLTIPEGLAVGSYIGFLTVKNEAGCKSSPIAITINVNESPTITTTGVIASVEATTSSQNASLTYTEVSENPTSYYIDWDAEANTALLTDQESTPFTFVSSGGVINTIVIPANVPAGTYTGLLFISNETCSAPQSQPISITITDPAPTIALDASAAITCYADPDDEQSTTLAYTGTTGNPTTYSIVWNSSPANSFEPVTDALLPTSPITIGIPTETDLGTYTGTLTVKNANGVVSSDYTFTLFVDTLGYVNITNEGKITSAVTSIEPQITSLTYLNFASDLITLLPTKYSIDWNDTANAALLVDQPTSMLTFKSEGGQINTIIIPANVPSGTYYGVIYFSNESTCIQSQPISITINDPAPTIALATSTEDICPDINAFLNSTPLSYSATSGSPVTYSIVWDASSANILSGVTDAPLQESPILVYIQGNTPAGTYTGTLTVKNANGVVSSGNIFTLTVNQKPTLTTTGVIDPICSSNNLQNGFFKYTASSGSPISYSIDWDQTANDALLVDKPTTSFTFASGGGLNIFSIEANVLPGTYSGTITVNNTSCSASYPISITVTTGLVGGTVTGGTTITSGSTSGLLTLSGTTSFVTRWQSSVSPFTVWSNIFTTNTTYTSGPLTETTQFRAVVQSGTCFAVNSDPTTVTVLSAFAKSTDTDSAEKITSVTAFNQVLTVETTNQAINQVSVFDVSGNLLYKKKGISDSKLVINSLRSSNQVLIVKVVLNDNRIATKKVIY
ncbi:hypothetical protein C8C83_1776 [Flavobacterium sp. 90]|uniref:T9SS sorting signal type C domain-containing protein n=1 Tax=unclassified Flavobacterium TaxID=196869 RepID=UPI000EB207D8|nr:MULTISPECIES: T9SS sorting signal type C domain-containing protein [unclassified Flavobacterium]RKR10105.1 hypothetical protein C8C82_2078 [Flavobacterium sp. 81]TCK53890.1 hypothetical protein C8C83_1776 [Flavobacterium sp. 90]